MPQKTVTREEPHEQTRLEPDAGPRAASPQSRRSLTRVDRLCVWMVDHDIDCTLVVGPIGVNHLCGYWRYFGSPPALIVVQDGHRSLLVSTNEAAGAREGRFADDVLTYGTRGFGLVPDQTPLVVEAVIETLARIPSNRMAIASELPEFERLLVKASSAHTVSARDCLRTIRLVKDADELERISAACRLAWVAQQTVREAAREGISELELFTQGFAAAQLAAQEPIAFVGDLLIGERSAEVCAPVCVAGSRRAALGEPVLADLLVGLRGYWADSAETLVIGDGAAATVREQLMTILASASHELRPGQSGSAVSAIVRNSILKLFPTGEYPHHAGHGVGLSPSEDPHLIEGDLRPLETGMVIALEPGVYFAGRFGVRVERLFVVTEEGGVDVRDFVTEFNA